MRCSDCGEANLGLFEPHKCSKKNIYDVTYTVEFRLLDTHGSLDGTHKKFEEFCNSLDEVIEVKEVKAMRVVTNHQEDDLYGL